MECLEVEVVEVVEVVQDYQGAQEETHPGEGGERREVQHPWYHTHLTIVQLVYLTEEKLHHI